MDFGHREKWKEAFLDALNKEADPPISAGDLNSLASWIGQLTVGVQIPLRVGRELARLRKARGNLEGFEQGETLHVYEALGQWIKELERVEENLASIPSDPRLRRRVVLRSAAHTVHSFLSKHGVKDANFWTAGVIFIYAGIELPSLNRDVKKEIDTTRFWRLNKRRGSSGYYLRDYVRRLMAKN